MSTGQMGELPLVTILVIGDSYKTQAKLKP